jgi:MoaA/NifB/PqqE/SkfB family radical SAM enzyme
MTMTSVAALPLPRSIYIEPTSRCNELCQQCPRTLLSREEDRDLSFDEFRRIVDQFPVLERVVLHGLEEPLLNKDLPRMICICLWRCDGSPGAGCCHRHRALSHSGEKT